MGENTYKSYVVPQYSWGIGSATLENHLTVSCKVEQTFTTWPKDNIPSETNYLHDMKTYVYTKTCIQMFMEALFGIAKNWKHKCSSLDEWLKKMCYMSTLEYYLAVKTKRLVMYSTTWICRNYAEWKSHLLKITYYIITFT